MSWARARSPCRSHCPFWTASAAKDGWRSRRPSRASRTCGPAISANRSPRTRMAASGPSPETTVKATPKRSRRTVFLIMGVVLLGLLLFGARKWWFGRNHVSTDNAQVDGHIVPILPKVGGYVAEVRVDENHAWKAGETLVVLDDRDFRAR